MKSQATTDGSGERELALEVVQQLRDAGFEALWAGGCVRDLLLERAPQDYDVATSARPEEVRHLFGHRRTLAVGQAFGVIIVMGRPPTQHVEVATFRRDLGYSDGRRPDAVAFSSAEEDAQRRDFTINGLFLDPLSESVVDYVDGQADIEARTIRAIGNPHDRFSEDKLRVLRAVRFATTLDFEIEPRTWRAVCQRAAEIDCVSAERVTAELKKLMASEHRARGLKLLIESGLLQQLLPAIDWQDAPQIERLLTQFSRTRGSSADFTPLLALVARHHPGDPADTVTALGQRWRLTKAETQGVRWLLEQEARIRTASEADWPEVQPLLVHPLGPTLVELVDVLGDGSDGVRFCRERLAWPAQRLNPAPLLKGKDLTEAGIAPGPVYQEVLQEVRRAQLLEQLTTKQQALAWAKRIAAAKGPMDAERKKP